MGEILANCVNLHKWLLVRLRRLPSMDAADT